MTVITVMSQSRVSKQPANALSQHKRTNRVAFQTRMHTASAHLVKTRARERRNTYAVRPMRFRKYARRLHCVPGTSLCSKIEAELARKVALLFVW